MDFFELMLTLSQRASFVKHDGINVAQALQGIGCLLYTSDAADE